MRVIDKVKTTLVYNLNVLKECIYNQVEYIIFEMLPGF